MLSRGRQQSIHPDGDGLVTFAGGWHRPLNQAVCLPIRSVGSGTAAARFPRVRGNRLMPASGARTSVLVDSAYVPWPVAVRFAFTDTAEPNLINTAGLPVAPFRTHSWDVKTKRDKSN